MPNTTEIPIREDRAAAIAAAIQQIATSTADPIDLRRRLEELLRDEISDIAREIAADRELSS